MFLLLTSGTLRTRMGDLSTHFSRAEFACKCGCGFNTVDAELLVILEALRGHFDEMVKITSGCRCADHNRRVGGRPKSKHLIGRAADVQVDNVSPSRVADYFSDTWPDLYGVGRYPTFTHFDSRDGYAWRG